MKNFSRAVVLFALALCVAEMEGCTSACIRHTDCSSNEQCISGTCIVVAVSDG